MPEKKNPKLSISTNNACVEYTNLIGHKFKRPLKDIKSIEENNNGTFFIEAYWGVSKNFIDTQTVNTFTITYTNPR